ncbi:restriction endonuclease subunit S [Vibrio harveyi]|uniref:restriction endonuclease subunit S n=1 Tax=Vibrio harveyi TaxID=669 RepID=UPI0025B16FBA|nr:restriction endonuclease subunit S [Vibrio harveyi]WJT09540.1 restriction endonuclease subunit S [Vibrio harveyi]
MSCNTTSYVLGDLVELSQGLAINVKTKHVLSESGLPLLRIADLISRQYCQFVNPELAPKKCLAVKGDLIYTRTGQVGLIFRDQAGVIHNNSFKVIPDESKVRKDFLYWFLSQSKIKALANDIASGSVQKDLNHSAFKSIAIELPDFDAQDRAIKVLDSIDQKITLNTQTNQTLEQMAQAIFKSWFVDFDPVKAKMNGEQPEGMDAATASLFPEKLVESELGLIPEGWSIQTVKSLSEKISKGTTPSKKDLASATDEPSIRFIKVKDINDQGEILRDKLEVIPESIHVSKLKRSILEREDILFSIAGTIGRVAIVDQDLDNVNTNQAVAFVRLKDKQTYLPLVYMSMRENRLQQKAISSIVQGVQANLSLANVGDMEVIVPSEDILNLWNKHYSSILQMIKSNFAQSRLLAALRDTLLPKLLSGEIELETAKEQ